MKQYFSHLLSALIGRNPSRKQLDAYEKQILSLQNLVENLRERIREKDEQIEQMRTMGQ